VAITVKPGGSIKRKALHKRYGGREQGGISPSGRSPNVFLFMDKRRGAANGYIYDGKHGNGTLHYTGEGRFGDQRMKQGNRAIRDHKAEGRALHVFKVSKGTALYLGEFRYLGHYDADAPPSGGGEERKVIVFVLRRVRGTIPLPDAEVDLRDSPAWVKKISVERHLTKEKFSVSPKPYQAKRREQKLVKELEDWLVAAGHAVCSLEMHAKGEASAIRCDLFDETDNAIVEAKSSVSRPAVRMAIGQLLDYARLMKKRPKKQLILVPEKPRPDLLDLAASQGIGVTWPDGDGGFSSTPPASA
jgi:hypothetical protein